MLVDVRNFGYLCARGTAHLLHNLDFFLYGGYNDKKITRKL